MATMRSLGPRHRLPAVRRDRRRARRSNFRGSGRRADVSNNWPAELVSVIDDSAPNSPLPVQVVLQFVGTGWRSWQGCPAHFSVCDAPVDKYDTWHVVN